MSFLYLVIVYGITRISFNPIRALVMWYACSYAKYVDFIMINMFLSVLESFKRKSFLFKPYCCKGQNMQFYAFLYHLPWKYI